VWLQACDIAMALLRWRVEPTSSFVAMVGRVDGYAALQRLRVESMTMLLCSDGTLGQRLCCSVVVAPDATEREKEKKRARKRKKERALKLVWSRSS
jgi:hypothetical protein